MSAHYHLLVGEFGSGKSLRLLEYGLELAERYRLGLIANFPIDLDALKRYCVAKKYRWILSLIPFNRIRYLPTIEPASLDKLLDYRNTVILLDEAGIFLNARAWASTPKSFLAGLVQCRKSGLHVVIACHFLEQIDKQLRDNSQRIIECRGFSIPWRAWNGRPRLLFRWWHNFAPRKYQYWLSSPQFQQNWLRTWLLADVTSYRLVIPWSLRRIPAPSHIRNPLLRFLWSGWEFVPSTQSLLFQCFDSFHRLDHDARIIRRRHYLLSKPERAPHPSGVWSGRLPIKTGEFPPPVKNSNEINHDYSNSNPVR